MIQNYLQDRSRFDNKLFLKLQKKVVFTTEYRADSRFLCVILRSACCMFVCGETIMEGHMREHGGNHHGSSHPRIWSPLYSSVPICHVW